MNVIKPIHTPQSLLFIPRYEADTVTIWLLDELLEKSYEYTSAVTYLDGYMTAEITHDFKEGDNYSYEISDMDGNLMYRGKIFITDQNDIQNYKVDPDLLTL
ncbi:hypothetical protein [Galbibacter pacificus]|uniref:Uncharacterized protein n=1 Tax=Galbibacter pacificus TaxID=2996052 RepID=A0ABT6FQY7_9FLAO|nr:hypothetical protein [Galbibacter pacificus]MDG3582052.1 hypothetical protein [Galbibacter pacificus]MDG3585474.1 hypothetical protein [Galbibacter pacificus]